MATSNTGNQAKTILILSKSPMPKTESSQFMQVFTNPNDLHGYACAYVKDTDNFELHASGEYLDDLLKVGIQDMEQIRCICVYYDNEQARQAGVSRFPAGSKVAGLFKACLGRILEGQLENAETAEVVTSLDPINRLAFHSVVASKTERLQEKQSSSDSPAPKRFARSTEDEFPIPNLNRRFHCPFCQILFLEPYQLECGHWLCKSCLVRQNSCAVCSQSISKDTAWLDRSLYQEQQQLITTCLECSWSGTFEHYREHENQHASGLEMNRNLLHQEHLGSIERLPNAQAASFGGIFIWKIPNVQGTRTNSLLQWPNSIYSPPFYSSPSGYKMCLRSFLNGDNSSREPNDSQSRSFWSDTNSISFQRPRADMNIAYGIPECFPRDIFQQNGNPFVRDDALLIKIQIEFLAKKPEIPFNNDDAHELLDDAILLSSQLQ